MEENRTVYVRGGRYFIEKPLELTAEDSGLTLMPYPGEKVVLSGAKRFENLAWTCDENEPQIRQAFIGKNLAPDQLFVGEKTYILARYPNFQEGVLPLGGTTSEADIKERSQNWANPTTGYLRALDEASWSGSDYYITGKEADSPLGLSIEWVGDNNRINRYKKDDLMVENIREELDCEGEWFYDAQSGMLLVYPYEDQTDFEKQPVELSLNSEIFRIVGEAAEHPAQNITLKGFTIEKTRRTMFTTKEEGKQYIPLLRGDWAVVRSGSIYLENTKNIVIEDCEFSRIGGNGIFGWGYQEGHQIRNNEMKHIGASAIQLVGKTTAVSDASFWEHAHYPEHQVHANEVKNPEVIGPISEEYPRDIQILENHIYDVGVYEKQSSGINLSVSSRIQIVHNTIHRSSRSNININDGSFGGHEICGNLLYESQRETADHGPFNSWGRDRFWSVPVYDCMGNNGKTIRHYQKDGKEYDLALLDAYQTTKIHHNCFHHDDKEVYSWGIDLDDVSSNYEIYENLCLGIGIKLREGFERKVHHNVIIDGQMQIHCTYFEAKDQICSNLFIHDKPWGFAGIGIDEAKRLQEGQLIVDRNCYFSTNGNLKLPDWWEKIGYDLEGTFGENPGFCDPQNGDYTITNEKIRNILGFSEMNLSAYGKHNCECRPPVYEVQVAEKQEELCETAWLGAVISNIDQAIMSSTATAGTNGVYFKAVSEDSEAYKLGYRTHQVVKQVEGIAVENVEEFIKLKSM